MSTTSHRATVPKCPHCGVALRPGDTDCWLCYAHISSTAIGEERPSGQSRSAPPQLEPRGFSLASLMMFITLVAVIFGLSTIAPGIGIPLGVLLLVAWGRTFSISRQQTKAGTPFSTSEKIAAFFSSVNFIISLLMLVTLALFIGFGSICYGLFAASQFEKSSAWVIVAVVVIVVGASAALGLLHLANKWNDNQFWRAAGRPKDKNNDRNKR